MQLAEIGTIITRFAEDIADAFGIFTQRTDGAIGVAVQGYTALVGIHACQQNATVWTAQRAVALGRSQHD